MNYLLEAGDRGGQVLIQPMRRRTVSAHHGGRARLVPFAERTILPLRDITY